MKRVQIIAIISGVITFLLVFLMNAGGNENTVETLVTKQIVTAAVDILPYTEITRDMLTVKEVDENSIHLNAVLELEDAIGKINTIMIMAGEPVLSNKIDDKDTLAAGLALKVTPGKRAFSLEVDDPTGVANNLRVGNWVDVIAGVNYEIPEETARRISQMMIEYPEYFSYLEATNGGGQRSEGDQTFPAGVTMEMEFKISSYLLQDIKVLAVDSYITSDYDSQNQLERYQTVTLEVEPVQALFLDLASREGHGVRLILREQSDHETFDLPAVESRDLVRYLERFNEEQAVQGETE